MDRLSGLMPFVRTAELGSFAAAGRALGLSASAVGKGVARLETQVGVRLFQRSTRSIRLTDEGRLFQERCRRILDDLDDAQATLARSTECPRGRLKVTAPTVMYHALLPFVPAFIERYPEIELDVDFSDRMVDLIEEGVDIAIRGGDLPDSRLMSRPLPSARIVLCASPAYLQQHGTPECLRDLGNHLAIRFRFSGTGKMRDWHMVQQPDHPELRIKNLFVCNSMDAVKAMTLQGLGIGGVPDFLLGDALAEGRLVEVLPDCVDPPSKLSLVWPSSRHLSPKVRVFVDFMSERLFTRPE
ncbi:MULTISPECIES: LysR family transcriptional regulator [unclassified Pseudomonas]|uniref:LysR family transcriptional regulator n=1 Tax=unclassified Pseudomonas TaxID=196821 RepID=UPI0025ED2206|nr:MULTISPECIES: LysR family transcriptional regulator [unclassified Pseudomonas]